MSLLVSFMKFLNFDVIEEVAIFTDDVIHPNGYGININGVILTAFHVIENKEIIKIKSRHFVLDLVIDEYDLALLKEPDKDINYDVFLNDLCKYAAKNNRDIDSLKNNTFYIKDSEIQMIDSQCDYIKTNLFPPIPVFIFSSSQGEDYSGYSGCGVIRKNILYGLLISQNIITQCITALPINIIYMILSHYINNSMRFYYLPINLKKNIVGNNYRNLMRNDVLYRVNNIKLNDGIYDGIYDNRLMASVPLETYLLLNGFRNINIEYYRIIKNKEKLCMSNVFLKIFDYENIKLNFKDSGKQTYVNDLIFSELSEENILEMYRNNIRIPNNIYDNIYSKTKTIYLKEIRNCVLFDIFKKNNVNLDEELYILHKVSGKKINGLSDLEKYKELRNITVEVLNSGMISIKIKI